MPLQLNKLIQIALLILFVFSAPSFAEEAMDDMDDMSELTGSEMADDTMDATDTATDTTTDTTTTDEQNGEIKVFIGDQGGDKASLSTPQKGQSKADIEAAFGTPLSLGGPIGQPPISTWKYAEFTVFFEYDHVIHTVLKPIAE